MQTFWKSRSFRFWLAMAFGVAVAPLGIAGVVSYSMLTNYVLAPIHDVAARQQEEIRPIQQLRLLIGEAAVPLEEFVRTGRPAHQMEYRAIRGQVMTAFADLRQEFEDVPQLLAQVVSAQDDWTSADRIGAEAIATGYAPQTVSDALSLDLFESRTKLAADGLGSVYEAVSFILQADYDEATQAVKRAEIAVGVAAIVSLLGLWLGLIIIGRLMAASVDRLVTGAVHFANGDREYRIDIQVPPDLRRVADEFNRMINRIHKSEAALANLARHDALTSLPNRRAFNEALAAMFEAPTNGGALFILDIDHFKRVNDTYGHGVGDIVLETVARLVAEATSHADQTYRIGGEEFGVLLSVTDQVNAKAIAERCRQAVAAAPIKAGRESVSVTVSIGVATVPPFRDPAKLLEIADAALYEAKSSGRNTVVVGDPLLSSYQKEPIESLRKGRRIAP